MYWVHGLMELCDVSGRVVVKKCSSTPASVNSALGFGSVSTPIDAKRWTLMVNHCLLNSLPINSSFFGGGNIPPRDPALSDDSFSRGISKPQVADMRVVSHCMLRHWIPRCFCSGSAKACDWIADKLPLLGGVATLGAAASLPRLGFIRQAADTDRPIRTRTTSNIPSRAPEHHLLFLHVFVLLCAPDCGATWSPSSPGYSCSESRDPALVIGLLCPCLPCVPSPCRDLAFRGHRGSSSLQRPLPTCIRGSHKRTSGT
jgi:hypothetical protein